MIKISAIIITKNAEELIADCLDSLFFCDEIVIIDNKSEDKTRDIAKKMGAKVFEHDSQDFSEARNFGLKKVTAGWILYVDADERVSKELAESIKYSIFAKATADKHVSSIKNNNFVAFKVKRKNFYFGNHEWPYIEHLERLFKKNRLEGWYGKLHESPKIKGEVGELDGHIIHYSHRNLTSMLAKTIEWSRIEAELRYESGHPKMTWWRFPRVMLTAFFDSYVRQGGWKVGAIGIIESFYQSFSIFITYAKLWELQNNLKNQNAKLKITS